MAVVARGKQVCSCFDVSAPQIDAALRSTTGTLDQRLQRLQDELKCGTNCGSCLPELKHLVRLTEQVA